MPESIDQIKTCFYVRWFSLLEKKWLKKSSPDGFDEVYNLRAFAGRLTSLLCQKEPAEYTDKDLKLLATLVRISVGIGALLRGNATIQGKSGNPDRSLDAALDSLEEDWSQA
jgi:hypothetical protein